MLAAHFVQRHFAALQRTSYRGTLFCCVAALQRGLRTTAFYAVGLRSKFNAQQFGHFFFQRNIIRKTCPQTSGRKAWLPPERSSVRSPASDMIARFVFDDARKQVPDILLIEFYGTD
jgi:hypothetical protein